MCGLSHEASSQPVSQPQCSLATRPNQHLSGRVLPPLVICAVGAHYETGSSTAGEEMRFPLSSYDTFWLSRILLILAAGIRIGLT